MLKLDRLTNLRLNHRDHLKTAKFALIALVILLLAAITLSNTFKYLMIDGPDQNSKLISGQIEFFNIDNKKLDERVIKAKLVTQSPVANFWMDEKNPITKEDIDSLSKRFAATIYPNNMKYFANRQTAEQIKKVNILITDLENTDGYFSAGDLRSGHQSNLIFLNASVASEEKSEAAATLAHEFAHLIYYLNGAPQNEMLDEALAAYAESANGKYPHYAQRTDYGQAFLLLEKAAKQVESSGGSVHGFTRSLASGSNRADINTAFEKYFSNPDLNALGELVDGNAQREVSLTSAFLRFAR